MDKAKGILFCLIISTALSGCTLFSDYGKITAKAGYDVNITLEDLISNCERYDVYYGGSSENLLTALMFDPRDDNLTIIAKDWVKIEDRQKLHKLVVLDPKKGKDQVIATGYTILDKKERLRALAKDLETDPYHHIPFLRLVVSPDNRIFGYIFISSEYHVVVKVESPEVLSVQNVLYEGDPAGGPTSP